MKKTARATEAATHAAATRKLLRKGYVTLADCALETYFSWYGNTSAYRRLYREVTVALYNARKEVK